MPCQQNNQTSNQPNIQPSKKQKKSQITKYQQKCSNDFVNETRYVAVLVQYLTSGLTLTSGSIKYYFQNRQITSGFLLHEKDCTIFSITKCYSWNNCLTYFTQVRALIIAKFSTSLFNIIMGGGWRDGSVMKNTGCSSRGHCLLCSTQIVAKNHP